MGQKKKKIEERMAENIPNLMNDINLYTQGAQWAPSRINLNKTTLRHISNF